MGLWTFVLRDPRRRPSARQRRPARRRFVLERLEERLFLANGLWLSTVTPLGGVDRPFDELELRFSEAVQAGTFTVEDVQVSGPGGTIAPLGLDALAPDTYRLHLTGLTGRAAYRLDVGVEITASDGRAMDQDRDGNPGEAADTYQGALFSTGVSIAALDTSYDGKALVIYGAKGTIDGTHVFDSVEVLGGGVVTHSGMMFTPGVGASTSKIDWALTGGLWIDAASKIDVTHKGYVESYSAPNITEANGFAGGSYGGWGGSGAVPTYGASFPNQVYGDFYNPNSLGSGSGHYGATQHYGGAKEIAFDANGNLYSVESGNSFVARIDPSTGVGTLVAGLKNWQDYAGSTPLGDNGPATSALLLYPDGVALDNAGHLFISSPYISQYYPASNRVRQVDLTTGIITTLAGGPLSYGYDGDNGPASAARLGSPTRVAVDNAGHLFIADHDNNRIRQIDLDTGTITTVAGTGTYGFGGDGGLATDAQLAHPYAVYADNNSRLFIADLGNQRIRKIDLATGIITTVAGNGTAGFSSDGGPAVDAALNWPRGMEVDASGRLLIADGRNCRIRAVDLTTGVITTIAGNGGDGHTGNDGPATAAQIGNPEDVAVDASGNVFLSDARNGVIRRIDAATQTITTLEITNRAYGGGLLRIIGASAQVDGSIRADGGGDIAGGSGGGIYLNVGTLMGSGWVQADGGNAIERGGAGGGGRIAIYTRDAATTLPADHVTAAGGTGGTGTSTAGTVHLAATPYFDFSTPDRLLHGTARLTWHSGGMDYLVGVAADITAYGDQQTVPLAVQQPANGSFDWDTTTVTDGMYELRAVFHDAVGNVVWDGIQQVIINNSAAWYSGTITSDQTWSSDRVHVVTGPLTIVAGVTLTIQPGTVIKFVPGTNSRLNLEAGATLNAPATPDSAIVFTAFADDSDGDDTNRDGEQSRPEAGAWFGFDVATGAQLNLSADVQLRYAKQMAHGGIYSHTTLLGTFVYEIDGTIEITDGATLTIQPGAILKFHTGTGIRVWNGNLVAQGTLAQPIVFTSIKDDAVGGDTNQDGNATRPAPGDWAGINLWGDADLNHVQVLYAGWTSSGGYEWHAAAINVLVGSLNLSNSLISDAAWEGIINSDPFNPVTVTNTVIRNTDRALNADNFSTTRLVNGTLDHNRIGIFGHSGTAEVSNTIISNSLEAGVTGSGHLVRHSNVWSTQGVNYDGTDQTGIDGNISADPLFYDRDRHDYRLFYGSPAIDAADGTLAPTMDAMGSPRYDDPRSENTGTATADGAFADMGAFEFVETAPSRADLVVTDVTGPTAAVAGDTITLSWTITNIGTAFVTGPWHDSVCLMPDINVGSGELCVGDFLQTGQAVVLGVGQSYRASAQVRVPGGLVAPGYLWEVKTNSRGDIYEGANASNNTTAALAPMSLDVPLLPTDNTAVTRAFTGSVQAHWFRFTATPGQDIRIEVTRPDGSGATELYIGQDFVPDPTIFDARQVEVNAPSVSAVASSVTADTYYVLVYARSLNVGMADFTITAHPLMFGVGKVVEDVVGNTGQVTLLLEGGQLRDDQTYRLIGPTGDEYVATGLHITNSALAMPTFDLTGVPEGRYDVEVTSAEGVVTRLPNAVTVEAGTGPRFDFSISTPAFYRNEREVPIVVTYTNTGNQDVKLPLFTLSIEENTQLADVGTFAGLPGLSGARELTFLAPAVVSGMAVIPPGMGGSFTLPYKVPNVPPCSQGAAPVFALRGTSFDDPSVANQPLDWPTILAALMPADGDPVAWQEFIDESRARYGDTYGSLFDYVAGQIEELAAAGLGDSVFINGRWYQRQHAYPPTAELRSAFDPTDATLDPGPAGDGLVSSLFVSSTASGPAPAQATVGQKPQKVFVVVIGSGENIYNTIRDAYNQKAHFDSFYEIDPANITMVLGDRAHLSPDVVKAKVQQVVSQAPADSVVVVWNNSHGDGNALSPGDAGTKYDDRLMKVQDWNQAFAGAKSRVLFIDDTCHSAALASQIANPNVTSISAVDWNQSERDAYPFGPYMIAALQASRDGDVLAAFGVAVARYRDAWIKHLDIKNDPRKAFAHTGLTEAQMLAILKDPAANNIPTYQQYIDQVANGTLLPGDLPPTSYANIDINHQNKRNRKAYAEWGQTPHIYNAPLGFDRLKLGPPDVKDPAIRLAGDMQITGSISGQLRSSRAPCGVRAWDPNDLAGPLGFGDEHFLPAGTTLPYTIEFENDPEKATAAAQTVVITNRLDAGLDWTTFQLTEIGFGSNILTVPPGQQHFADTVPMTSNGSLLLVRVNADLDLDTGLVTATFTSIDPLTNAPTKDPLAGFLPVDNDAHDGQGHVSYTVRSKDTLATGTRIGNQADIVFDINEPLTTPEHVNTIDAGPPSSAVDPLPGFSFSPDFTVTWLGQDDAGGSGIAYFDVYISDNGGPFTPWIAGTSATSVTFTGGVVGHTYSFYSLATDQIGHGETPPAEPDAQTLVTVRSWCNHANPFDVDAAGGDRPVVPLDVLILINYINANGPELPPASQSPPPYYDVDDSGFCTPRDVLLVINYINSHPAGGGEGEAVCRPCVADVPEAWLAFETAIGPSVSGSGTITASPAAPPRLRPNPERSLIVSQMADGDSGRSAGRVVKLAPSVADEAWLDLDAEWSQLNIRWADIVDDLARARRGH